MDRCRLVVVLLGSAVLGCQSGPILKGTKAINETLGPPVARAQMPDAMPKPPPPPSPLGPPKAESSKDKGVIKPVKYEPPPDNGTVQPPDPNIQPVKAANVRFTGRVVARVGGTPILEEDAVSAALNSLVELRASPLSPAEKANYERQIIRAQTEQLIDREVLLQDAFKLVPERTLAKAREFARKEFEAKVKLEKQQLKIGSDEDYEALLESFGLTMDHRRRQFERNFIATEYMRNRVRAKIEVIAIDREQLLEYYEKNPQEFNPPESVKWLHIFVNKKGYPTEAEARQKADLAFEEAKKCNTKEDFAALAERMSDGPSSKRKGEGEGSQRGQIKPAELEDLVFKMKPGDKSPLMGTESGYHLLLVVSHEPGGKIPFDQACPTIRNKLQNEAANLEFGRFLKDLRAKAYIEMAGK